MSSSRPAAHPPPNGSQAKLGKKFDARLRLALKMGSIGASDLTNVAQAAANHLNAGLGG